MTILDELLPKQQVPLAGFEQRLLITIDQGSGTAQLHCWHPAQAGRNSVITWKYEGMIGKKLNTGMSTLRICWGRSILVTERQDPHYLLWKQSDRYSLSEPSSFSFWISVCFCNQLPELIHIFKPSCVITGIKEFALVSAGVPFHAFIT